MSSSTNGLAIHADRPPLQTDEAGAVRVGSSRVSLDVVVQEFKNGMTPEKIVSAYDALTLSDVYAVIAYYLRYPDDVDAYLQRRGKAVESLRASVEANRTPISREELLARRRARELAHAPAGE